MRKIKSESNVYSTCTYCLLTNGASQLLVKLCIAVHGLITLSYYRKKKINQARGAYGHRILVSQSTTSWKSVNQIVSVIYRTKRRERER